MSNEDYMYIEQTERAYVKVVNLDGVKTTVSANRFEICVQANTCLLYTSPSPRDS